MHDVIPEDGEPRDELRRSVGPVDEDVEILMPALRQVERDGCEQLRLTRLGLLLQ